MALFILCNGYSVNRDHVSLFGCAGKSGNNKVNTWQVMATFAAGDAIKIYEGPMPNAKMIHRAIISAPDHGAIEITADGQTKKVRAFDNSATRRKGQRQ